jgi:phage terminase large subunit-like protein
VSFIPTSRQREAINLLASPQRHTGLVGGSRSGKTTTFTRHCCIRALKAANSRHVILRRHFNSARKSIWLDTLPGVIRKCWPQLSPMLKRNEQDCRLIFPNDAEVWVAGLDDKERIEKILGTEYATIYFCECSEIPWPTIPVVLTRLAQNITGLRQRAYYDLNPTGTGHWTYRLFIQHQQPESREKLPDPENYRMLYMNPNDNAANLTPEYIASLASLPEKQRKRFLLGEYVAEVDGALWTMELIEQDRIDVDSLPQCQRVVIAVDPSGSKGEYDINSDEIGLVAVGLGVDKRLYILEDRTGAGSPEQWSRKAVHMYHKWQADAIVGEANFGGDMVRACIHSADRNVRYKPVTASRGKAVRAEPVAGLYEQHRVSHAGRFPQLEDQLLNFSTAGYMGDRSPNNADALVWGVTELALDIPTDGLLEFYRGETVLKVQTAAALIKPTISPQTPTCTACGSAAVHVVSATHNRCGQCGATWQTTPTPEAYPLADRPFANYLRK